MSKRDRKRVYIVLGVIIAAIFTAGVRRRGRDRRRADLRRRQGAHGDRRP